MKTKMIPINQILNAVISFAFIYSALPAVAQVQEWAEWPVYEDDPDKLNARVAIPNDFVSQDPLIEERRTMLINGRFQSPQGNVTFAVTAASVRNAESGIDVRRFSLPLREGERVTHISSEKERAGENADGTDYYRYQEWITIEGPKL